MYFRFLKYIKMKSLFSLLCIAILGYSCTTNDQPRSLESIQITTYTKDSTSIRAIHAIDDQTAYFAGSNGDIHHTKDGGKTWTIERLTFRDSIVPHFRSMASNGKAIFALSIGNPAILYKLENGSHELVYVEKHPNVFYDAMTFSDALNGIAMGDQTDDCVSIIVTSDGGNSWKKLACSSLPTSASGEAAFAASNTNIKTLGNTIWIATGGMKSRIFKSQDLGKTWEVYETPIVQGSPTQGMYSVDFADELHGIVVGGDYSKPLENTANKAITTDGGLTWQLVAEGQNPNYKSCVQYVPNTAGKEVFAVGKTGISFSNDGGMTWKEVSKEEFYSIQFVNKHTAWLSGHKKTGKLTLP